MVESKQQGRVSIEVYLHQEGEEGRLVYGVYEVVQNLIDKAVLQLKWVADPEAERPRLAGPSQLPTLPPAAHTQQGWLLICSRKN